METILKNMVIFCAGQKEFVAEFNRLTGHHMGERRNAITTAVDNACGYDPDNAAMPEFVRFVLETVYMPLCGI